MDTTEARLAILQMVYGRLPSDDKQVLEICEKFAAFVLPPVRETSGTTKRGRDDPAQ